MATIDRKDLINDIIRGNGSYHPDDPLVAYIVEYENAYGATTWGVTWVNESRDRQLRYLIPTEYVNNPRLVFDLENSELFKELD